MRLLDEKGKLFGLINIIDLLVILLAGVLIASFIRNLPLTVPRNAEEGARSTMYIKVLCRVPVEVAENKDILRPGDKFLSGMATLEKVLKSTPVANVGGMPSGYTDVIVLIKTTCTNLRGEYYCANMPVKINTLFTFSNNLYVLKDGLVVGIEQAHE